LLLAAWLTGSGAWGENSVSNGSFDTDVSGWTAQLHVAVVWSAIDANLHPGSGSAEVTNTYPTKNQGSGIVQCVDLPIVGGAAYDFGGKAFIPDAQDRDGSAQVGLRWYEGVGCSGSFVGEQPRRSTETVGAWVELTATEQLAPGGATSVLFLAFPSKREAGSSLIAYFDDLYFRKTPIFADGLESGDLRAWSSTTHTILDLPPYADQSEIAGLWWPYCDSGNCPWNPPTQTHDGLDFTPNQDLAVFQASAPGVVTDVSWLFNTGNGYYQVNVTVAYAHDQTHALIYAFEPMSASIDDRVEQMGHIDVVEHQTVALGDVIGRLLQVGAHAHVHFGFLEDWTQICPEPFMSDAVRTELRDLIQRDIPTWEICN
jgi:hypothetical protein